VNTFAAMVTAAWMFVQIPAAAQTFEVASIKRNADSSGRILVQMLPGGGLRTSGATMKYLISLAYDVKFFQISGGPRWIEGDRFDIVAKPEHSAEAETVPGDPRQVTEPQYRTMKAQMRPRLQALLADRFQLELHRETREAPIYAMVEGKGGPKLVPDDRREGKTAWGLSVGKGQLTGNVASLPMLVTALSNQLGRPVVDRTGLTGTFDFKLEWTPDTPRAADADSPPDSSGLSLFTAIQQQLGLRLEARKGPVEMLMIDRVEKPSEN
jgi:bla regulator protein BlaR1